MAKSSAVTAVLLLSVSLCHAEFPDFQEVVIDPEACRKAVYAVTLADVDGDGRDDIVAVTENAVVWYENPSWTRRVLIEDQTELDNVCIAPHDVDGDGKVDFALGAGWTKVGTIQWLTRGEGADDRWKIHSIGVEPWTHRMRWADVLGEGRPQLVVSPLNATAGNGVRLTAFSLPADPASDPWPRTVLDDTLNRMHNHWHTELNGDGVDETLTASQEGIHFLILGDNGRIKRRQVAEGMPGERPQDRGTGELKLGRLGSGRPFLAAIEPMHGTSAVIYTGPEGRLPEGQFLDRLVIDDTLNQGHAVWIANLDDDDADEVVIGHREAGEGPIKGPGVYVFDANDPQGTAWTKHVIDDGGMACEDAVCGDLNGDGRIDIVAGGRSTRNVKLYLNQKP